MQMLRSAVIGFTSSIVSDVTSNPIQGRQDDEAVLGRQNGAQARGAAAAARRRERGLLREYCDAHREGGRRPGVLHARPVDADSGERAAVDRVLGRLAAALRHVGVFSVPSQVRFSLHSCTKSPSRGTRQQQRRRGPRRRMTPRAACAVTPTCWRRRGATCKRP